MRLLNKVVLITGSASGIGRASAILFSQEGAKISVVDIDRKGGEQTVDLIKQKDGCAMFYSNGSIESEGYRDNH
jgi:NAD(P)-dependent dehydrogenase (short-subunit alcohol dehydrogenase family)